jgi:phosphatidate cytidylyltransferase
MLLPRILTAVVGIPLLLFLVHWGGLAFALFTAAIAALILYEYGVMLLLGGKPAQRAMVMVTGAAMALCQAVNGPLGIVLAVSVAAVVLREMFDPATSLERAALTVFGAVFLGWMPAHLALVRDLRPYGETLTFMLFISIWVCDTSAYFVGRMIGRQPLAPVLSPKKTWEGFVAGFAGAVAVVLAFRARTPAMLPIGRALGVAVSIGIFGQLSDLAESMIKRSVGAKDSGALLPGHGGIMDRFDSYILAAPAVYYCLTI